EKLSGVHDWIRPRRFDQPPEIRGRFIERRRPLAQATAKFSEKSLAFQSWGRGLRLAETIALVEKIPANRGERDLVGRMRAERMLHGFHARLTHYGVRLCEVAVEI